MNIPNCYLMLTKDIAGNFIQGLVPFGDIPSEKHFGNDWDNSAGVTTLATIHASEIRQMLNNNN